MNSSLIIPTREQRSKLLTLSLHAIAQLRAIIWYPGFKGSTTKFNA